MKVLVTGATGFIGGRFVSRALEKGMNVVCLARRTSRVEPLREKGVPLVFADIEDGAQVSRAVIESGPDTVVHCAASVMSRDEDRLFRMNVGGTRNICRVCREAGVGRLVYLSSVAVVGGNTEMPLTDRMPYKAKNAYGRSKIEAERIALDFRDKGLPTAILRPCMIYGEEEPHALDRIFDFMRRRMIPLLEVPRMDSRLQLGYVDNVADSMELALFSDKALGGTFIVADDEVITLRKFLEISYEELGAGAPPRVPGWAVRAAVVLPPVRRYFERIFRDREYDISRAKEVLGYAPEVSTEEGLRKTARYWRKKNGSADEHEARDLENVFDV